jgi:hypothetical protein
MTKLALLISENEGFGGVGNIPTRDNNPGDLRHSPHSSHAGEGPNGIGEIDTVADGWADLERELQRYATRTITTDPMTLKPCAPRRMTMQDMAYTWAPPADGNPTAAYLATLCRGLGMPDTTLVADALKVQA